MNSSDVGLAWILSDHLGSTTKVIRALDYAILSETRYKPFGQPRYVNGVSPTRWAVIQVGNRGYNALSW